MIPVEVVAAQEALSELAGEWRRMENEVRRVNDELIQMMDELAAVTAERDTLKRRVAMYEHGELAEKPPRLRVLEV